MKKISFSGRAAVVTALILAIGVPATAMGFGEGRNLLLGKRNPSRAGLSSETQIIADNTTYGTRQSNLRSGDGGGAIYGCRSAPGHEPCIRSNNLTTGRAFEFATRGNEGGRIETGNTAGAPFTTNATGVATGAVGNATIAGNVYTVKFNRDVSKCSYTVSPQGASVPQVPGVAAGTDATTVNVDMGAARAFYLQVIC
jgi:hypothetical protein